MCSRCFHEATRHYRSGTKYKQKLEQCHRFEVVAKTRLSPRLYISGWHYRKHHTITRTSSFLLVPSHCSLIAVVIAEPSPT